MVLFILTGLGVIGLLIWLLYERLKPKSSSTTRVSSSELKYDNQYDVFRDMEPISQTRENPWMGILQVDLTSNSSGTIGNFKGSDSQSGTAFMYEIDMLPDTAPAEKNEGNNKMSVVVIQDREYGPGSYDFPVGAREIKVYGPVDILALSADGTAERLHYDARPSGYYNMVLDGERNWTKFTVSSS